LFLYVVEGDKANNNFKKKERKERKKTQFNSFCVRLQRRKHLLTNAWI